MSACEVVMVNRQSTAPSNSPVCAIAPLTGGSNLVCRNFYGGAQ